MVLSALTTSLKVIFKEQNDSTKDITIYIPANIRFKFYPTREKVLLENKFAAMTIVAPLTDTMQSAYKPIKNVTKQLKSSLAYIYAVYAISFWSGKLAPRFLILDSIEKLSQKATIAFSNSPGPIKPFMYQNPETGGLSKNISA